MLYEYNKKVYIKPFSNKLVEVEIKKDTEDFDIELTNRTIIITPEIEKKIETISLENAYKKFKKNERRMINTI